MSALEEVIVFFLKQLPSDEYEEMMLFFNELDDERREMYLQDCMKIDAKGTPVEVGSQIFKMTQIRWLIGSCDTTIEMVEEKEDMEDRQELTEVTAKDVEAVSEVTEGVAVAMKEEVEAVEDIAMKPMDTIEMVEVDGDIK